MNRQYNNKDNPSGGGSPPGGNGDGGGISTIPSPGYPTPSSAKAASEERSFNVPYPTMPGLPSLDPTMGSNFYHYPGDPYSSFHDTFDDY